MGFCDYYMWGPVEHTTVKLDPVSSCNVALRDSQWDTMWGVFAKVAEEGLKESPCELCDSCWIEIMCAVH